MTYKKGVYRLINCHIDRQAADIFTKAYSNADQWQHYMRLIGVVSDDRMLETLRQHVVTTSAVAGQPPTSKKAPSTSEVQHSDTNSKPRTSASGKTSADVARKTSVQGSSRKKSPVRASTSASAVDLGSPSVTADGVEKQLAEGQPPASALKDVCACAVDVCLARRIAVGQPQLVTCICVP